MTVVATQSLRDEAVDALNSGSHKQALRCFTALEKLEPENGEWSWQVGLMYHRLGKRRRAISALERAARCCHVHHENERARAIYEQILRLEPEHDTARRGVHALRASAGKPPGESRSIEQRAGVRAVPASSASFPTVRIQPSAARDGDTDGFGLPRSKADRVAMALASLLK